MVTITTGGPIRPINATAAPSGPRMREPNTTAEIHDVRPGQELREREALVEFLRRHPALVLHDHAARPGQHAAEAGDRAFEEAEEEFGEARNVDGSLGLLRFCDGGR